MTSPSDSEPPANHGDKRGWGVWISLGVIGLVLVVLLVLPGFLAAGFSRVSNVYYSDFGEVDWDSSDWYEAPGSEDRSTDLRVELMILAPSGWLMGHSRSVRLLYNWEYRIAGGANTDVL